MSQPYSFSFAESLMAKNAGISLKSTHFDVDAILKAYDGIKPLAEELGVDAPRPRLAGFGYPHLVALGAPIEFPEDGEPNVFPLIHTPEEIDNLKEPENYLAAPLIQKRLKIAAELGKRRKDASSQFIGHGLEGPITTAVLLMGHDFLTLPYDDPKRAHRLLNFCTESALHYVKALHRHFNGNAPVEPGPRSIPDDFAGMLPPEMFGEFVVPYWNRLYDGRKATERNLHSELLHESHLPFLRDLN
ncbi:MAG: uroporphyrinogen decarboxylase family protein [Kiritimatiellia bacterium]|nr:uroporphyrinogen decarboxylase family protein [Kiritimatiellia bacterium]